MVWMPVANGVRLAFSCAGNSAGHPCTVAPFGYTVQIQPAINRVGLISYLSVDAVRLRHAPDLSVMDIYAQPYTVMLPVYGCPHLEPYAKIPCSPLTLRG